MTSRLPGVLYTIQKIHSKEMGRKTVFPGRRQEQGDKGNPPEMFRMEGGSK
jgi:hypothetical protein